MRNLFLAAVASLVLVPASWAQDKDKDNNKNNASDTMTIRGTVAGVTVEGETAIDLRNNSAMTVEGAFLTVVGSPSKNRDESGNRATEGKSGSERVRDNIYLIWLTPRTKISERNMDAGKTDANAKKDVGFDQLEVGECVEIQFTRREESGANTVSPKTEQMRKRHGRHRTYSGYATAITIIPKTQADKDREREREKDRENNPSNTDKSK
jgi:hypothetical protein